MYSSCLMNEVENFMHPLEELSDFSSEEFSEIIKEINDKGCMGPYNSKELVYDFSLICKKSYELAQKLMYILEELEMERAEGD